VEPDEFAAQVSGVAALAEPVRRDLYRYVAAQPGAVSRDDAAAGVGLARHTAKFHLDRLVEEGLLEVEFRRLTGRVGPGAGRPTKLYRRSDVELSVELPERSYDVAGAMLAQAIEESVRAGSSAVDALRRVAAERGTVLGRQARDRAGARPSRQALLDAAVETMARNGYEPRADGTTVTLANCPFHRLASEHMDLVCGMNLAMLGSLVADLDGAGLSAGLEPAPDRCCVVLAQNRD
jgi:predicted ArsR family transcriptional regulator